MTTKTLPKPGYIDTGRQSRVLGENIPPSRSAPMPPPPPPPAKLPTNTPKPGKPDGAT